MYNKQLRNYHARMENEFIIDWRKLLTLTTTKNSIFRKQPKIKERIQ